MTSTSVPVKILVVEDNPIAMLINCKMLEEIGHTPDRAENGKQALAMFSNNYDIIFMDIGLPDTNGFEVVAKIRRAEGTQKHVPIVALTAYSLDDIGAKCLQVGMDGALAKPTTVADFQMTIQKFVTKKNSKHGEQAGETQTLLI